jgi:hypothetical protein
MPCGNGKAVERMGNSEKVEEVLKPLAAARRVRLEADMLKAGALLGGLVVLCLILGSYDAARQTVEAQYVIGAITLAVLGALLAGAPPEHRLPTIMIVVVATDFECFGSLLCGFYQYRLHNLPVYVPTGHGIFYLCARRVLDVAGVKCAGRKIVVVVVAASGAWVLHGLFLSTTPDFEGALWWVLLVYFLWRRNDPLLYAVTFALTMGLEFYGTGIGAWHWAPHFPGTTIPAGNPPSACAAGYCVLDASAMRLVRLWRSHRTHAWQKKRTELIAPA